jgi:hypothetical protein
MQMKLALGFAAVVLTAACAPALAHHSFAMFDNTKTITLSGTVIEFEWVNPHTWIHLMVKNDTGVPEEWAFEMGSVGNLAAVGWKKASLKPGDVITITARPMKDGSHGGSGGAVKNAAGECIGRCAALAAPAGGAGP